MTALIIGITAFAVSLLTLFAGFGLGTLLMPVFALFFPVEVAVASTAVVHAANNVFKVGLLARDASGKVLLRFGLPAIIASFAGALVLTSLSALPTLASWTLLGRDAQVTPVKLVLGILILTFAALELAPGLRKLRAPEKLLPLGGAISGFFGGLSGHQGALRAAFLLPLGLSPMRFVATAAVLALMVDFTRLIVYGWSFASMAGGKLATPVPWDLVAIASLCAFAGAFAGKRLLHKVTIASLHYIVGTLLIVVGLGLALGLT